ncbi:GDSL-like Lipase/Acylhydrolase family protein [compost metagenome]
MMFSLSATAQSPADVVRNEGYSAALHAQQVNEQFYRRSLPSVYGDSNIANLDFRGHLEALNFGIKGDTSFGLAHRMGTYVTLKSASAVFLLAGVNDLGFGAQFDKEIPVNYVAALRKIPIDRPVRIIGILPVLEAKFPGYNARSRAINLRLEALCRNRSGCAYIRPRFEGQDGDARKELYRDDGIHLNERGQLVLINAIKSALNN